MLLGGFVPESTILLRGAPCTGKTTIAFHFLLECVKQGEPAMLLAEETRSGFAHDERGRLSLIAVCILLLRYLEIDSAIQRAIVVLKMRSSNHYKSIHPYQIGPVGVEVGLPFASHVGLLNGLSRQTMISTVQTLRPAEKQ